MISVLWRAQPPENIHFTHRNEKAHGDWGNDCERNSVSHHYLNRLKPPFWTSSCLSTISLRVDIYKTEEEANRGGTGDGLCVADLWQEKAPAVRVLCGSVLWRRRFRGDGGTQEHYRTEVLWYRCKAHIRFLFPLNRGKDGWGRGSVLFSWSLGFLGPGHVITAWPLTRQSLDQPLRCPPKSHSVQRVVQPPWGREW